MGRSPHVMVLSTAQNRDLSVALAAAFERTGVHALIDLPGREADQASDLVISTRHIGAEAGLSACAHQAGSLDFLVLLLRDDPASVTNGFMALKRLLVAREMPRGVAFLVDAPSSALVARQTHRVLNRAVKNFLRLELIHSLDLDEDGETMGAAARSLARRISVKLRLHQSVASRAPMVTGGLARASG